MSGTDAEDLPDDTEQAIHALKRLVEKHGALDRAQALEAVQALVEGVEVDASPEELLDLAGDQAEAAEGEEKESPTA